jgi:hypothetical protein
MQTKRGRGISLTRLDGQTHRHQLGRKIIKSKGNEGNKVKDVSVIYYQREET